MVHAEFRAILAISSCISRFVKFGFVTIEIAIIQEYGAEKNSLAFFKWGLHFKEKEILSQKTLQFCFVLLNGQTPYADSQNAIQRHTAAYGVKHSRAG